MKTLIEIFGKGFQCVAYGDHPDTGVPYRWLGPGQEPLFVPFVELPEITTEQIYVLRDRIRSRLVELGYNAVTETSDVSTAPPVKLGTVADAVDVTRSC